MGFCISVINVALISEKKITAVIPQATSNQCLGETFKLKFTTSHRHLLDPEATTNKFIKHFILCKHFTAFYGGMTVHQWSISWWFIPNNNIQTCEWPELNSSLTQWWSKIKVSSAWRWTVSPSQEIKLNDHCQWTLKRALSTVVKKCQLAVAVDNNLSFRCKFRPIIETTTKSSF